MGPERRHFIRNTRIALERAAPGLRSILERETRRTAESVDRELRQTLRYLDSLNEAADTLHFGEPYGEALWIGSSVWPVFYGIQLGLALLLTGNRPTWKPSEHVGASARHLHRELAAIDPHWASLCLREGDRELGRQLACSKVYSLVMFQGTYEAGMRVLQDNLPQPGKEILLFLGAKNPVILLDDLFDDSRQALADEAFQTVVKDCFSEGGQHCLGASVVFVPRHHLVAFTDRFAAEAAGHPIRLLDAARQDRYLKFIGVAEKEGARLALRGKPVPMEEGDPGVQPTISVFPELSPREFQRSTLLQTEISGPHVTLIGYGNSRELCSLVSGASYGLACAVHGRDPGSTRFWVREHARQLPFGTIRINGSLLESDPWKSGRPYGKSGNHGVTGEALFRGVTRSRAID